MSKEEVAVRKLYPYARVSGPQSLERPTDIPVWIYAPGGALGDFVVGCGNTPDEAWAHGFERARQRGEL